MTDYLLFYNGVIKLNHHPHYTPFSRESTGHCWISLTKSSEAKLWWFSPIYFRWFERIGPFSQILCIVPGRSLCAPVSIYMLLSGTHFIKEIISSLFTEFYSSHWNLNETALNLQMDLNKLRCLKGENGPSFQRLQSMYCYLHSMFYNRMTDLSGNHQRYSVIHTFNSLWYTNAICRHISGFPSVIINHQLDSFPPNTWRSNDVVITSKRRHFDVVTSKWRRVDVKMASILRNVCAGLARTWVQLEKNMLTKSNATKCLTISSLKLHLHFPGANKLTRLLLVRL